MSREVQCSQCGRRSWVEHPVRCAVCGGPMKLTGRFVLSGYEPESAKRNKPDASLFGAVDPNDRYSVWRE